MKIVDIAVKKSIGLIALTARAGWRRIRKNWKILAGRCVSSIVRYAEKNDT